MLFVIFRWIIYIAAFFAIIIIWKTDKRKLKRLVLCAVVAVFAALMLQFSVYIESTTITFASCEEAFEYKYNKECSISVDGKTTAFAEGDGTIDIFLKTDEGYRTRTSPLLTVSHMIYKDISCIVYKHIGTNEHYLMIATVTDEIDLSENKQLKFTVINEGATRSYYTYLPDFVTGYTLIINGDEIALE